ncbi:DUF2637 domain-containing protein [Streptomyces sp. BP-8]|uniref:DUF2637 domain-containing protein n=1 Tax=Streptomyces sirii TaxID=3127701 RepID=A0ABZ2QPJ6_9ACTN
MTEDRITQRTVTIVMIVIAALAFVFSFGNVWALAIRLGVPQPVAPLIAPMVDLSVVGLLVALRYLSLRGVPADKLKSATRLMHLSGLLTLGLNVAEPILAGHYGRAAVDAVAPLLLLGWGSAGHQHQLPAEPAPDTQPSTNPRRVTSTPEEPASVEGPTMRAPSTPAPMAVPLPLLKAARSVAADHRERHGQHITPAQLQARLGVALPLATAAHAQLTA